METERNVANLFCCLWGNKAHPKDVACTIDSHQVASSVTQSGCPGQIQPPRLCLRKFKKWKRNMRCRQVVMRSVIMSWMPLVQLVLISHMIRPNEKDLFVCLLFFFKLQLTTSHSLWFHGNMTTYANFRGHVHEFFKAYIYIYMSGAVWFRQEKNFCIAWVQFFKYRHAQYVWILTWQKKKNV